MEGSITMSPLRNLYILGLVLESTFGYPYRTCDGVLQEKQSQWFNVTLIFLPKHYTHLAQSNSSLPHIVCPELVNRKHEDV